MSAVASARETTSPYYRLFDAASPLWGIKWKRPKTPGSYVLLRGSIIEISILDNAQRVVHAVCVITDIRTTSKSPVFILLGRELVARDRLTTLAMADEVSAAVAASVSRNELVDIGNHILFGWHEITDVVREITVYNCQTISLPTSYTAQPTYRRSIAFAPVWDAEHNVCYTMNSLLFPICDDGCRLGRVVYTPDRQCTHWCAQCSTWMHRGCMAPAPSGSREPIEAFMPMTSLRRMWEALAQAPIVRTPRPGLPPQSIELLIRDIRASGAPPTCIAGWMLKRGHAVPHFRIGDWLYFVCPRCKSVI